LGVSDAHDRPIRPTVKPVLNPLRESLGDHQDDLKTSGSGLMFAGLVCGLVSLISRQIPADSAALAVAMIVVVFAAIAWVCIQTWRTARDTAPAFRALRATFRDQSR
jgi:hypothetical protein